MHFRWSKKNLEKHKVNKEEAFWNEDSFFLRKRGPLWRRKKKQLFSVLFISYGRSTHSNITMFQTKCIVVQFRLSKEYETRPLSQNGWQEWRRRPGQILQETNADLGEWDPVSQCVCEMLCIGAAYGYIFPLLVFSLVGLLLLPPADCVSISSRTCPF